MDIVRCIMERFYGVIFFFLGDDIGSNLVRGGGGMEMII